MEDPSSIIVTGDYALHEIWPWSSQKTHKKFKWLQEHCAMWNGNEALLRCVWEDEVGGRVDKRKNDIQEWFRYFLEPNYSPKLQATCSAKLEGSCSPKPAEMMLCHDEELEGGSLKTHALKGHHETLYESILHGVMSSKILLFSNQFSN